MEAQLAQNTAAFTQRGAQMVGNYERHDVDAKFEDLRARINSQLEEHLAAGRQESAVCTTLADVRMQNHSKALENNFSRMSSRLGDWEHQAARIDRHFGSLANRVDKRVDEILRRVFLPPPRP